MSPTVSVSNCFSVVHLLFARLQNATEVNATYLLPPEVVNATLQSILTTRMLPWIIGACYKTQGETSQAYSGK